MTIFSFFQFFQWRHNGHFICFPMGHSHGRNFKAIFFKLTTCLLLRMALYGIANQRTTSSSSGQNDGWKNRKKTKWHKTQNKSPILIDFDLLNTNMCMVCRFDRYFRCKWPLKLTEIEFMRVLIRLQLKYNLTNFDKTAES